MNKYLINMMVTVSVTASDKFEAENIGRASVTIAKDPCVSPVEINVTMVEKENKAQRCNCETTFCEESGRHLACECPNEADAGKVEFFGIKMWMCNDCVLATLAHWGLANDHIHGYKPDRCKECGFVLPAHQHWCSQRVRKEK